MKLKKLKTEKTEILKATENLWNERNKLKELERENAELKGKADIVLNNWCKVDDPCSHLKKRDEQLIKAKEIIKNLLQVIPKENIEGVYEVVEMAEEFLRLDI